MVLKVVVMGHPCLIFYSNGLGSDETDFPVDKATFLCWDNVFHHMKEVSTESYFIKF